MDFFTQVSNLILQSTEGFYIADSPKDFHFSQLPAATSQALCSSIPNSIGPFQGSFRALRCCGGLSEYFEMANPARLWYHDSAGG